MSSRIHLQRIHQTNGPDYWKATCYIQDHSLESYGTTKQKALDEMFARIDSIIFKDWYLAHSNNADIDYLRQRQLDLQVDMAEQAAVPEPPPKWSFWNWFK